MAAYEADEIPVGCVIVHHERIIAAAHNQRVTLCDATAHAEMLAITQACESVGDWRLSECDLYVTLEPCPMCAGAILQSRIPRVIYGAVDSKAGAVESRFHLLNDPRLNHQSQVIGGVLAKECGELLTQFFLEKRRQGKK